MKRIAAVMLLLVALGLVVVAAWWEIGGVKGVPISTQPTTSPPLPTHATSESEYAGPKPAEHIPPPAPGRTLPALADRIKRILTESRSYGDHEVWLHQAAFVGEGQSGNRRWALAYAGKFGLRGELVLGLSDPGKQRVEHFYLTNISAGGDLPTVRNAQVDISHLRVMISWDVVSSYPPEPTRLEPHKASASLDQVVKDSDRDGYPDLLEKRLGLNPRDSDTDNDGLRDGIDANPQVAPRNTLTEERNALQAALYYGYATWEFQGTPMVVHSPYPPQEFHGLPDIVLVKEPDLSEQKGRYLPVQIIRFHPPVSVWLEPKPVQLGPVVQFCSDRKTARLMIAQTLGGLDARGRILTLQKEQGKWKVVTVKEDWIS